MSDINIDKVSLYNMLINLKPASLRLWLLMYALSDDTGRVETSFKDIQNRLGMAKTTTSRSMKELRDEGLLETKHSVGNSSEYLIKTPEGYRKDKR